MLCCYLLSSTSPRITSSRFPKLQVFPHAALQLTGSSFYNVERTQIRPATAIQIHYTQPGGVTGHVMLLCMLLMYTTAHHRIRQQSFETFWYTHHLFIPFLLGLYTHAVGCFVRDTALPFSPFAGADFWEHCIGYQGWRWELWAGGLYLAERLYRQIRAIRQTKITRVVRHPYGKQFLSGFSMEVANAIVRCRGDSVRQAIFQVQGRSVAIPAGAVNLRLPVASIHHHLLPLRPLRFGPRPTGW